MKIKVLSIVALLLILSVSLFGCGDVTPEDDSVFGDNIGEAFIGDTVEYDGIEYTVEQVRNTKSIDLSVGKATTDNNFIYVNLKITNKNSGKYKPELKDFWLSLSEPTALYEPRDYIYGYNRMGTKAVEPQTSINFYLIFETGFTTDEKTYTFMIRVKDNWVQDDEFRKIDLKEKV